MLGEEDCAGMDAIYGGLCESIDNLLRAGCAGQKLGAVLLLGEFQNGANRRRIDHAIVSQISRNPPGDDVGREQRLVSPRIIDRDLRIAGLVNEP